MSEPYIGEIRMFAGYRLPRHWAFCDGQSLLISDYNELYALIGTSYGGDGRVTFALPDLRGRVPMHYGDGPGLKPYPLASRGGEEAVKLTTANIPAHNHHINASSHVKKVSSPEECFLAAMPPHRDDQPQVLAYGEPENDTAALHPKTLSEAGRNRKVANMGPYLTINFIIALRGVFPSRS